VEAAIGGTVAVATTNLLDVAQELCHFVITLFRECVEILRGEGLNVNPS
jgi:hypothetical protein